MSKKTVEQYRADYPNLNPDVTVHICNSDHPMDIAIADKVEELKQLWIHEEREDLDPNDELEYHTHTRCLACGHEWMNYLGFD